MKTPWGDSVELRGRRMAPGRGSVRAEVEQNQRERLYGAMVALCAEKEYAQTSIEDLARVSGVSSRAFYELFTDKEDCFLATMEEILRNVQKGAVAALRGAERSQGTAELAIETFIALVAAQPAAARLCMVSAFSAGERPRAQIARAVVNLSAFMQQGLEALPDRHGMPVELTRAILGGVAGAVYRRLGAGEMEAIAEVAPRLRAWALSIPPPPRPLRPKARRKRVQPADSPPFAANVPGERVLRGFAAAVAEHGYTAATIAEVAAKAQISQNTFYTHFRDKEDALYAALDSSGAQMVAATLPAVRRAPEWPGSLRVAMETICGFLMAEPDFAYLREVEVYAVGPRAVAMRNRTQVEIFTVLQRLAEPQVDPADELIAEAMLGVVEALLYDRISRRAYRAIPEMAPIATYVALAPQLGAEEAWQVACG